MLAGNVVKGLVKNYFYESAFKTLYSYGEVTYRSSYRTTGNRIRNIGGIFDDFYWDCEFVNGILFKISIKPIR